jgi:hypothetical protein
LNVGNESALPKSNQDKEANAITSKCPHYSHDSCLLVLMDAWAARAVMPLMLPRLVFRHWRELCRRGDDVIDIFVTRSASYRSWHRWWQNSIK